MPSNVPASAPAMSGTRSNARAGARAHHQLTSFDGEAVQLGRDRLIGAARHLGVAGRDFDLVRARRFGAARDDEQRRQAVAEERGAERDEQRGGHGDGAERQQRAAAGRAARSRGRRRSRGTARSPARPAVRRAAARAPIDPPVGADASTALRIAASSDGSRSSRYSATWASVTRRRSGRTSP